MQRNYCTSFLKVQQWEQSRVKIGFDTALFVGCKKFTRQRGGISPLFH